VREDPSERCEPHRFIFRRTVQNGAMTMPAVEIVETELERVESWRAQALERAGFDSDAAKAIAARLDVDLHRAIQLLENGCTPELALRILL